MSTASDLIRSSLRLIGALATGENPSASEQAEALDVLNDILEEWSNDGFLIFEKKREEFFLAPSKQLYTIGIGGDFDTVRPLRIAECATIESGDTAELSLRMLTTQEWARIVVKSTQSDLPEAIYYRPTFPHGEISVYPVPSAQASIILYSEKPLISVSLASQALSLPPGYNKALKYALASELQPEYGKAINPKIEEVAERSKTMLKRTNTEDVFMCSDAFGMTEQKTFNWITGE